ncbi:MAG: BON domain-containing protein [Acidobacteria bacterium]|nr:BON domain-containing protein [Acidobacteriota bacterium]
MLAVLAGACLAQTVSDDQIYDDVRLRLAGDRDVKGGALEVIVEQGVVTLRGKVRTEKIKEKAGRLTRKVKGVKKVVNELQIEPSGVSSE